MIKHRLNIQTNSNPPDRKARNGRACWNPEQQAHGLDCSNALATNTGEGAFATANSNRNQATHDAHCRTGEVQRVLGFEAVHHLVLPEGFLFSYNNGNGAGWAGS